MFVVDCSVSFREDESRAEGVCALGGEGRLNKAVSAVVATRLFCPPLQQHQQVVLHGSRGATGSTVAGVGGWGHESMVNLPPLPPTFTSLSLRFWSTFSATTTVF